MSSHATETFSPDIVNRLSCRSYWDGFAYTEHERWAKTKSNYQSRYNYDSYNPRIVEAIKGIKLMTALKDMHLQKFSTLVFACPKRNSVKELAQALLEFEAVKEVRFYQKEKDISIWVYTNNIELRERRDLCHFYAERVHNLFDLDYLLNFRIDPSEQEQPGIPREAQVLRRG